MKGRRLLTLVIFLVFFFLTALFKWWLVNNQQKTKVINEVNNLTIKSEEARNNNTGVAGKTEVLAAETTKVEGGNLDSEEIDLATESSSLSFVENIPTVKSSWPVKLFMSLGGDRELISSVHKMPDYCGEVINPPYKEGDPKCLEIFVCGDPFEPAGPESELTVLAGHSSSQIDLKLNCLNEIDLNDLIGERIELTTELGDVLVYQIDQFYVVPSEEACYMSEIWHKEPGKLILVTCQIEWSAFFKDTGSKNIFVVAYLVETSTG